MQNVTDPREVIGFLRKKENRNIFGEGRSITGGYWSDKENKHSLCVQLRQFFGRTRQGKTLHYEINETQGRGLNVEIHSETNTPKIVHEFLKKQFEWEPKGSHGAYRFATKSITWQGRAFDDIVSDIKKAIDDLYRKYDAYLNYVEGFYSGKCGMEGCKSYADFVQGIS